MRILVQKFGGASLATAANRQHVVDKIGKARDEGFQPVVVVSAMGQRGDPYATDTLIDMVRKPYPLVARREIDVVMCCGELLSAALMTSTLQAAGLDALLFTGGQAGILTDTQFGNARILKVDPIRIRDTLSSGQIPVVCGCQGITADGDMTTLGRGGSDTTASALGAALSAEAIEIYSDTEGIMTADPRLAPHAHILDRISYEEASQLASQGANVIHPRAVDFARHKNIPLIVKSIFSDTPGTLITSAANAAEVVDTRISDRVATGITYVKNISQITVRKDDCSMPVEGFRIFKLLAASGINVDFINILPVQLLFTVQDDDLEIARQHLTSAGYQLNITMNCAKVSVVGGGMGDVPGVMASFVESFTAKGIPLLQTVDSQTSISALIDGQYLETAVSSLHSQFGLDKT